MGFGTKIDNMAKCMQYSLIAANIIFFICGICSIGIGAWIIADKDFVQKLLDTTVTYMSAAYILIVIGIVVAIISFLGCYGALKQNKCMLVTYAILLTIIFALFLTAAILGFVYKNKAENTIKDKLKKSMDKYGEKDAVKTAWDDTQKAFKCCGVDGYDDWSGKKGLPTGASAPTSCCMPDKDCKTDKANAYKDGCLTKIKEGAKDAAVVAGAVAIVIALLLILGVVFSCCLYQSIDEIV